jgi:hypothetical protein
MDGLPVCEVHRLQVGPLGLSLGDVDAGGGNGQGLIALPVVKVKWLDDRQTCGQVLAFIHEGTAPDLPGCALYHAGMCGRTHGARCVFHEDADAEVWRKAADWRLLPGGGAVHKSLWPEFGWEVMP